VRLVALAAILLVPAAAPGGTRTETIVFASDDAPHFRTSEVYVIAAAGGSPRNLTRNELEDVDPAWSPDGSTIAFARARAGRFDLYTMKARDGGPRRLTRTRADEREPAWSPDGRRLAFVAPGDLRNEKGYRYSQIFIVNRDGSGRRQLTREEYSVDKPSWAPDGERIAGTSFDGIFTMNADGSGLRTVSTAGADEQDLDPAWSPDGRQIVFTRTRSDLNTNDVWVMNTDGSGRRRIAKFAAQPAWSPDGKRIAFVNGPVWSCDPDGCYDYGLTAVATVSPGGGRKHFLTPPLERLGGSFVAQPQRWALGEGATFFRVSWSPDGRRLVYSRRLEQRSPDLFRISPRGGRPERLRATAAPEIGPLVSPDEKRIAFETHLPRHQLPTLELIHANGRRPRVLAHGGRDPDWSPDGSRLAWAQQGLSGSSIASSVVVADGNGNGARAIGTGSSPTWSADGRIAYVRTKATNRRSEIVVANGDGRDARPVLVVRRRSLYGLAWSPREDVLVFESAVPGRLVSSLWTLDLRSGRARRLTHAYPFEYDPRWSPDGSRIAFTRRTSNPYDRSVVCVAAIGRGARCLGRGRWRADSPAWSPDGTRIVLTSMRDGDSELYVVSRRGGAWRKLTENLADDAYPSW
jgi:Tol biopolymer transport system component